MVKFFLNIFDDSIDAVASKMAKCKFRTFLTDDHIDPKKCRDMQVMPMIASTNTLYAPLGVVESEDKKYGRLKVFKTVKEVLERELDD